MTEFRETAEDLNTGENVQDNLSAAEQAAAEALGHQIEYIDDEYGWTCMCDEHGDLPYMRFRSDAEQHQARAVVAAVRPIIEAETLREFADANRFPNDWIMFRRNDGSGVTVGDLLREVAAGKLRAAERQAEGR